MRLLRSISPVVRARFGPMLVWSAAWSASLAIVAAAGSFALLVVAMLSAGAFGIFLLPGLLEILNALPVGLALVAPLILISGWLVTAPHRAGPIPHAIVGACLGVLVYQLPLRSQAHLQVGIFNLCSQAALWIGAAAGLCAYWVAARITPQIQHRAARRSSGPLMPLAAMALTGIAVGFNWFELRADRLLTVTFDLIYEGKPISVPTTYLCSKFTDSAAAKSDAQRSSVSTALPNGKAAILTVSAPCNLPEAERKAWFEAIDVAVIDDALHPTGIEVYANAAEASSTLAMRLAGYAVSAGSESDRDAARSREVGHLVKHKEPFPFAYTRPTFDFMTIRAIEIPKSLWTAIPTASFPQRSGSLAVSFPAKALAQGLGEISGGHPSDWSNVDLKGGVSRLLADPVTKGMTRGSVTTNDASDQACLLSWAKLVPQAELEVASKNGRCGAQLLIFRPSDRVFILLERDNYTYLPVLDRGAFPGTPG